MIEPVMLGKSSTIATKKYEKAPKTFCNHLTLSLVKSQVINVNGLKHQKIKLVLELIDEEPFLKQ